MEDIVVSQLDCKVYLLRSVALESMLFEIATFVDSTLATDKNMLTFHEERRYKNYVISGFKEFEKDKIYKEGKVYTFSIRCVDENLKKFLLKTLDNVSTHAIKGLVVTSSIMPRKFIEKLYLLTPALIKTEQGYWKSSLTIAEYEKRLFENAVKKYKQITQTEINENFQLFNRIQFTNEKPVGTKYKNVTLLGDKFELYIADNEMAQKIAYLLLGTGVLEGNGRGYGFLNYKYM